MKTPEGLATAVDCGVIQEVVRPLMSGKEAQVYIVIADGAECVAKVYKEASQRTFKHRAQYTEGRRTRNSRDQRAINKRSRHGRNQDEAGWRNTEVDMIYRLRDAGVRVPEPINFVDGVLVMELVKDTEGDPAPRLGDLTFEPDEARGIYKRLLRETTRMLCAGVIHGDLSDFNVLMAADGPVVIDFPQSLEAARNQGARKFLLRDVENLHRFVERYLPDEPRQPYGEEMWLLYEANRLEPDTELRGDYSAPEGPAETSEVLALIEDADYDERMRREARGDETPVAPPMRTVVDFTKQASPPANAAKRTDKGRPGRTKASKGRAAHGPAGKAPATRSADAPAQADSAGSAGGAAAPKRKRSRRRRRPAGDAATTGGAGTEKAAREPRNPDRGAEKAGARSSADAGAQTRRRRGRSRGRRGPAEGESRTQSQPAEGQPRNRPQSQPAEGQPRNRPQSQSTEGRPRAGSRGQAEQRDKRDADTRGGDRPSGNSGNSGESGEAARPARRRRRRPRRTGSREPT